MNVTINGETVTLADDSPKTVDFILTTQNVTIPEMVSVQINGSFIDRPLFTTHEVQPGDEIEFLYFMGGGTL